jgi:hypothetical protein
MFRLEINGKTIYYLENPESGISKIATGLQLKYEDTIKDVFGVADLKDLLMMLKYNKGFQESICKTHGVGEKEITLDLIFRIASKNDLIQQKNNPSNK